ncbi:hypothetical protein [uncultured Mediterranean phage]|nr:hypothetical protein [uncultured Mediterranean phage]
MSKVTVELGLTLKMATGGGYNFIRPSITIADIDTEQDTKPQIDRALVVVNEAWSELEEAMTKVVTTCDVTENESLLVELGRRMGDMEKQLSTVVKSKAKAGF